MFKDKNKLNEQRKIQTLPLILDLFFFTRTKAPKAILTWFTPQRPFSLFPLFSASQTTMLEPSWSHCGERKAL